MREKKKVEEGGENQRQQKDFKVVENQVVVILSAVGPSVPATAHFYWNTPR